MKHRAKSPSPQSTNYIFQIESLSHEGRGIAHFGTHEDHPVEKHGKKVFIRYALPGETVKAKITNTTSRFEEAEMLNVIGEASTSRVQPICEHYMKCGGCSMQHIHPDEQIRLKQDVLKSHLSHFAGIEVNEWLSPLRSLREDYRRKARVGVRYLAKQKKLVVGFRESQSNRLTSIDRCAVLDREFGSITQLKQLLQKLNGKAQIGHIELAMGDADKALLVRHLADLDEQDLTTLKQFAEYKGWQLYLQSGDARSLKRIDGAHSDMRLHYSVPEFDVEFAFSPLDFTQVNSSVNPRMLALACELLQLKPGERVLDLFCGLGNFSLPLAKAVGATGVVIGVEGSEEMTQRGAENAKMNGIEHLSFYSQDLTKDFSHQSWAKQGFDALLIDPPRSGAEEVMQYLPNFGAKRIVYVSCNPATLARDAGILSQHGYNLKKAGVMDMFTHTGHVESIALFEQED